MTSSLFVIDGARGITKQPTRLQGKGFEQNQRKKKNINDLYCCKLSFRLQKHSSLSFLLFLSLPRDIFLHQRVYPHMKIFFTLSLVLSPLTHSTTHTSKHMYTHFSFRQHTCMHTHTIPAVSVITNIVLIIYIINLIFLSTCSTTKLKNKHVKPEEYFFYILQTNDIIRMILWNLRAKEDNSFLMTIWRFLEQNNPFT